MSVLGMVTGVVAMPAVVASRLAVVATQRVHMPQPSEPRRPDSPAPGVDMPVITHRTAVQIAPDLRVRSGPRWRFGG